MKLPASTSPNMNESAALAKEMEKQDKYWDPKSVEKFPRIKGARRDLGQRLTNSQLRDCTT